LLRRQGSTIGPLPEGRKRRLHEGDYPAAGYFEDPALFDAAAFGISPSEACEMDPQQRMALELAGECFEDAGYSTALVAAMNAGVFAGSTWREYGLCGRRADAPAATALAGTASGSIAGRISHFFRLAGPSLVVDSITSSSLSAVHLACQSLSNHECDLALALGVNLILGPASGAGLKAMGVLSRHGEIRPFDIFADGYQRGEGVVAVVLKRMRDAVSDRDRIHATISASALGHNGGASPALTAPCPAAQSRLLAECMHRADLDPDDLAYWEAHGTGTPAGDAAELKALRQVMGTRQGPLAVGSVKGNLGHLEAGAGLAGLLNAVLVVRTGEIPATRGHRQSRLDPGDAIFVPTVRSNLPPGARRTVGVTSLGMAGSNACVIVEPAPDPLPDEFSSSPVLVFSADSPSALDRYSRRLADESQGWSDSDLPALCAVAARRRNHLRYRRAVPAGDLATLRLALLEPESISNAVLPDWARRFAASYPAPDREIDLTLYFRGNRPASHPDLPPREWVHQPYWLGETTRASDDPREIVSSVLGCAMSSVEHAGALLELGMDSLAAMELSTHLRSAGYRITARELLAGATLPDIERRAAATDLVEVRI
jgi:acyl transferase domain-containing protein